ncbi:MAG: hypothetical protein MJ177_01625 [Clostridia bacterium]|nr:hypothetical protein [Clostridia bacterium]
MDKKIFVGIDGGGTKTTAAAFDAYGRFLASQAGDSVNFCALGTEKAGYNMKKIINGLCDKIGTDRFCSVFIGMSAIEDEATDEQLSSLCGGIIRSDFIKMNSDLYAALEGMCESGECVFAVSGTGSMAIAKDRNGKIYTSGGWGFLLGDEGSGYDIASKGIKAAVRAVDPGGAKTLLTDALYRYYGVNDLNGLTQVFYDPPMERSRIAAFCEAVCDCAEDGDEAAVSILHSAAKAFSENVNLLIEKTGSKILGIYGGVFEHSPLFVDIFSSYIKSGTEIRFPEFPPHIGAVIAAYKTAGAFSDEILKNIKNTYTDGKRNEQSC